MVFARSASPLKECIREFDVVVVEVIAYCPAVDRCFPLLFYQHLLCFNVKSYFSIHMIMPVDFICLFHEVLIRIVDCFARVRTSQLDLSFHDIFSIHLENHIHYFLQFLC